MRFCLMVEGQEGVTWERWLALAEACERLGFEGLFTSDHYFSVVGAGGRGSNDAWTVMAGLAARTSRLRLGTLVSPVTFRHPTNLAKIATTVDAISNGRVEIGLGAGWWEEEHRTHGFPFPPDGERMEMLEEQLEIVHGLLSEPTFSFESRHYALEGCAFLPKAVQRPHPPIIVGGNGGPRLSRLVATWADEFNTVGGTPDDVRERYARVRDAVGTAGRDQASVVTSFMTWVFVGRTEEEWRARVAQAHTHDPTAGTFEEYLADIEKDCIVGTPDRAAERLSEYAAAGVQRVMLNHELVEDLEMLELLATEILPRVKG
jgi:F420-dependent oxidoreductase-like protein